MEDGSEGEREGEREGEGEERRAGNADVEADSVESSNDDPDLDMFCS